MMLNGLSMEEYTYWVAYFSVNWETWKPDQTPETIKNNLSLSFPRKKRKK